MSSTAPTNYTDEKRQKCHQYMEALEQERTKIQVFQRELPLCLDLVTQAIDTCKQQLSGTTTAATLTELFLGQSECTSEQTSSDGPVLEQFIPLKRAPSSSSSSDHDDDEEEEEQHSSHKSDDNISTHSEDDKSSKKSDWLRSVQLWNQSPDPPVKQDSSSPRKVSTMEVAVAKNGGGAFHPFKKEKSGRSMRSSSPAQASVDTSNGGGGGGGEGEKTEEKGQSQRKTRRCWSPELHRRFLHALQQLGGSHVATPKQIRELMKVDGLTNDEVKSHLQKYRLHTRRPSGSVQNNTTSPQPPQFVVVGGIWVPPPPPPEYTAASGEASGVSSSPNNGIYPPIAALPPPPLAKKTQDNNNKKKQSKYSNSEERGGSSSLQSEGRVHSNNSPATSSSTHTTTASPLY